MSFGGMSYNKTKQNNTNIWHIENNRYIKQKQNTKLLLSLII